MPDIICPAHSEIQRRLVKAEAIQEDRPCRTHTADISALVKNEKGIRDTNKEQWDAINRLRVIVYSATPVTALLAFLGALLGTYLKK